MPWGGTCLSRQIRWVTDSFRPPSPVGLSARTLLNGAALNSVYRKEVDRMGGRRRRRSDGCRRQPPPLPLGDCYNGRLAVPRRLAATGRKDSAGSVLNVANRNSLSGFEEIKQHGAANAKASRNSCCHFGHGRSLLRSKLPRPDSRSMQANKGGRSSVRIRRCQTACLGELWA